MKVILLLCSFVFGSMISSSSVFANDDFCNSSNDYSVYECRVEKVCGTYKSPKPVYNSKQYPKDNFQEGGTAPGLEGAMKLYRENMGNIYKCAIIQSQKNSLTKIEKFLSSETSGRLADTLGGQIQSRIIRLDISSGKVGCSLTDTQSIQNKLNILNETTYEACKYTSYLEYIKAYYRNVDNTFSQEELDSVYGENNLLKKISPEQISRDVNSIEATVANEIIHTYRVFPLAYSAYSEYENMFPIHFLLELIEADFLLLREKMKGVLMPIAQLGLKMINAMSY